jgi:hypothetical protein
MKPGPKAELCETFARRWITGRCAEGYRQRDWHFEGYAGVATDGCSVGTRYDGLIVRLSSEVARDQAGWLLKWADNVSRLDVQVTTQDEDLTRDWAEYVIRTARNDRRCIAGITRTSEVKSYPGGHTTYIGTRTSDRYYRCYDKSAESAGVYPAGCWRWEVEYKGARAGIVAERIRTRGDDAETVRAVVEQAYTNYGITLPCSPLPRGWRDTGYRERTTDERRLDWLTKSVGPMVKRMMESTDVDTILEALGLEAFSTSNGSDMQKGGDIA